MVPASFDESNTVLSRPADLTAEQCEPLSVMVSEARAGVLGGRPAIVSCWKLTAAEMAEVQRTGRVWLMVFGTEMPVASVRGIKPIVG